MAEKFSKSILRNLQKMLHRAPKKPSASTSKKPSMQKKSARVDDPSSSSSGRASDQGGTPEGPEAGSDKKKTPNQPWYRHRQRW